MHVRLAASTGKYLNFGGHRMEEVGHAVGGFIHGQACHQLRILSGDSHRTASRVAVMAGVGFSPDLVIILHIDWLVTIEGNQSGGAHIYGIRS